MEKFSMLMNNPSYISAIAAIGSCLSSILSFLVAIKVFRYTKKKERLTLSLTFSEKQISTIYDIDEEKMKEIINDLTFKVHNPSLISSGTLYFELEDKINKDKRKLFQRMLENKEFLTDIMFSQYSPIIKKLQSVPINESQELTDIKSGETKSLGLPLFLINDLIQASFLCHKSEIFTYKRCFKLKTKYFHKQKHKFKTKTTKVEYTLRFEGALIVIYFDMKPYFITLAK
ncbi:hypothetical protein [Staphylococcus xylosus]|uniref:hypothetical protein n=2 Tax=Staphylococcus xylosus TaxID=1288 RepID=UPI000853BE46|nr:hypothetical protein [Staphylococcus xylosus]OEK86622.1 hypothetical protein AST17_02590 [Staphylococcus xylosus]